MNISEYELTVIKLCKEKSNKKIVNSSFSHNKLLTIAMIMHASENDRICILSSSLPNEVYDTLKTTKSNIIDLLVDRILPDDHWIFNFIKNDQRNIRIFLTENVVSRHFLCTSSNAFRFEPDNREKTSIACFNDQQSSVKLLGYFDKLLSQSTLILKSNQNRSSKRRKTR